MKLQLKNDKVYYYDTIKGHIQPIASLEIEQGKIAKYRINNHLNKAKISYDIIDKMEIELINHYHNIAITVNNFIDQLPDNTMYKVNRWIIETVNFMPDTELYINYDFRLIDSDNKDDIKVRTGYYSRLYGKINDNRIGRRKLYCTTKGFYFNENGFREYLNKYSIK